MSKKSANKEQTLNKAKEAFNIANASANEDVILPSNSQKDSNEQNPADLKDAYLEGSEHPANLKDAFKGAGATASENEASLSEDLSNDNNDQNPADLKDAYLNDAAQKASDNENPADLKDALAHQNHAKLKDAFKGAGATASENEAIQKASDNENPADLKDAYLEGGEHPAKLKDAYFNDAAQKASDKENSANLKDAFKGADATASDNENPADLKDALAHQSPAKLKDASSKSKLDLMYVLPNLFTAASIFFAVLSMLAAIAHDHHTAIKYLIISLICDGLDGRVARAINRTSKFGVEFDSLADIVAFGVAPAVLFYYNLGEHFGRFGVIAMAVFIIFGAVRLARFNITTGTYEPNVFIGLPIPTAAVVLSLWTVVAKDYSLHSGWLGGFVCVLAFGLGFLMVSNVRYPSFKKLHFSKHQLIKVLVIAIFVCSLIYLYPLVISTAIMSCYLLYGLVRTGYNLGCKFNVFKGVKWKR